MSNLIFRFPGGKGRLSRKWLVPNMPKVGNLFIDVFGGMGNVTWAAMEKFNFKLYLLNDINTYKFFVAVRDTDFEKINYNTDKDNFIRLRDLPDDDPERILLEHYITWSGTGFTRGNLSGYVNLNGQ